MNLCANLWFGTDQFINNIKVLFWDINFYIFIHNNSKCRHLEIEGEINRWSFGVKFVRYELNR